MTLKNKILITALACCAVIVACLGYYRYKHSFLGLSVDLMLASRDNSHMLKYTHLPPEGKNMPIQSFSSIKAKGAFNIILQHGTTESLVMKDYDPGNLKVTNERDTLMIICTDSSYSSVADMKTNVNITYKQLNSLKMYLMGDIKTLDTINTGKFILESDGFGEKTLLLNADTVTATLDGAGTIRISGKAHYANFKVTGMDSLKAKDFKAGVLDVSVRGIGTATVKADSEIYLNATLGGRITYYGKPIVMAADSEGGMGKIEHRN